MVAVCMYVYCSYINELQVMETHVQQMTPLSSSMTDFCLSCVIRFCLFLLTAVIGLLYPCLDSHLGEPHKFKREWASVMRCVAVFVGINHASVVSFFVQKSPQRHICLSIVGVDIT